MMMKAFKPFTIWAGWILIVITCGCYKSYSLEERQNKFLQEVGRRKVDETRSLSSLFGGPIRPKAWEPKLEWGCVGESTTFPVLLKRHKIFVYIPAGFSHGFGAAVIGVGYDSTAFDLSNRIDFNRMIGRENLKITDSLKAFEIVKWWIQASVGSSCAYLTDINDIIEFARGFYHLNEERLEGYKIQLESFNDSVAAPKIDVIKDEDEFKSCIVELFTWSPIGGILSHWRVGIDNSSAILFVQKRVLAQEIGPWTR